MAPTTLRLWHADVGEIDGVLDVLAGERDDGMHLNSGRRHVDEQKGDALLRPLAGGGADQAEDPVGGVRVGRPRLDAVADEIVAVIVRAHAQRGEIGAGVRFGIALAPEDLAAQSLRQKKRLLRIRAVVNQDRADHADAHRRQGRRGRACALFGEDHVLNPSPVAAAISLWPCRRRPALPVQHALPFTRDVRIGVDARQEIAGAAEARREMAFEECAHRFAEGVLFSAEREVHRALRSSAGGDRLRERDRARVADEFGAHAVHDVGGADAGRRDRR